jgi:hypothetical protein
MAELSTRARVPGLGGAAIKSVEQFELLNGAPPSIASANADTPTEQEAPGGVSNSPSSAEQRNTRLQTTYGTIANLAQYAGLDLPLGRTHGDWASNPVTGFNKLIEIGSATIQPLPGGEEACAVTDPKIQLPDLRSLDLKGLMAAVNNDGDKSFVSIEEIPKAAQNDKLPSAGPEHLQKVHPDQFPLGATSALKAADGVQRNLEINQARQLGNGQATIQDMPASPPEKSSEAEKTAWLQHVCHDDLTSR